MEKEKLKDRLINGFKSTITKIKIENIADINIMNFFIFVFVLYFAVFFSKNLFIFLIINLVIILTKIIFKNNEDYKKLKYIYILVPSYSLIYIAIIEKSIDILLWLFLLIISIKISIFMFKNTFENIIFSEKNVLINYIGSLPVGIFIGLISALLLKQKIIIFVVINIILTILINLQEKFSDKIKVYVDNIEENKYYKYLIYNYNNLIFTATFVAFLMLINFIK